MRIDILTLFPDTLGDVLSESILGIVAGMIWSVLHLPMPKILAS